MADGTVVHVCQRSPYLTGFGVMLVLCVLASGCFDAGSLPAQGTPGCHIHSSRSAAARTPSYRFLVGLAPARRITTSGAVLASTVSVETDLSASARALARRVHLDVEVCATTGVPVELAAPPSVRLTDGGVAAIKVPMMRLRAAGEDEPAHFGANVAAIGYGPIFVTIAVDGERATLLLKPGPPPSTT